MSDATITQEVSSPSPISNLPQELINEIIDAVFFTTEESWPEPWRILSNCALVCKSFLPRSQMRLFSEFRLIVDLQQSLCHARISSLLQIIDNRPSIANHIQEFCLANLDRDRPLSWIYDNPEFTRLMERITAPPHAPLRKLTLYGLGRFFSELQAPLDLVDRFVRRFIAPYITSLRLQNLEGVPTQLITSCGKLEDLLIGNVGFIDLGDGRPPNSRPKIKRFEYISSDWQPALSKMWNTSTPSVNFSDLRWLKIQAERVVNLELEQGILDGLKASLEELYFSFIDYNFPIDDPSFSASLNLHNQPNLHTLEHTAFFENFHSNSLSDIYCTLKTIPTSNNNALSTLRLTLYVGVKLSVALDVLLTADWETLGSEISRIAGGRKFELSLHMIYQWWYPGPDEMFIESESPRGSDRNCGEDNAHVNNDYEQLLLDMCENILEMVVEERLVSLKTNPRIIVTQIVAIQEPDWS